MGIKVELKQGRRWWYVSADFGDGKPVSKGPMSEADARAMVKDLEEQSARMDGVVVREKSVDDAKRDRLVGYVVLGVLGSVLASAIAYLALVS